MSEKVMSDSARKRVSVRVLADALIQKRGHLVAVFTNAQWVCEGSIVDSLWGKRVKFGDYRVGKRTTVSDWNAQARVMNSIFPGFVDESRLNWPSISGAEARRIDRI